MKVVSPQQMTEIESQAYRAGSSESDFMEEAGSGVALVAHDYVERNGLDRPVIMLCGKGNNAGDAYVAGVHLLHLEYEVIAYQLFPIEECSPLCRQQQFAFLNEGGRVRDVFSAKEIVFPSSGIIVDGIFGTGFRGVVEEPIASIIQAANQTRLPIIAVDIPSGLDGETGEVRGVAIIASATAFLGLPKTGFFLRDGWNHVGTITYVNFGLPKELVENATADFIMLSPRILQPLLPRIMHNRHKYQAGHVVCLAGSHAMPGASMLSSLAALCSGAGIVHLLYSEDMAADIVAAPYELLKIPYKASIPKPIVDLMNSANATLVGPGLGNTPETHQLLSKVLPQLIKPCVLDADALNIIAEDPSIKLPPQSILTPHIGEMKRLLHITEATLTMEFLLRCQAFATDKNITLVLKGGPSFIFHPRETILVSSRGDPGMATAGSGDVLSGLLASLLAQGMSPFDAAALGVYIHGVAGENAAEELTSYCMTASDIISYLPDAFRPTSWTE